MIASILTIWSFPDQAEIMKEILKGLIPAAIGLFAPFILSRIAPPFRRFMGDLFNGWRLKRARDAVQVGGPGLWLTQPISRPSDYSERMVNQALVVTVANDKGGVGKTTLTANLACALAERMSKPVLVIDLDPQGTLSNLMFAGSSWHPVSGQHSGASKAVDGSMTKDLLLGPASAAKPFTYKDGRGDTKQFSKAVGLSCYYDLTDFEDRILVEWLIGDRKADILNQRSGGERSG